MEQRDYLERQIEQMSYVLGKIIARLLGLNPSDVATQGITIANQMLQTEADFDLVGLLSAQTDDVERLLSANPTMGQESLDKLADLLRLIGDSAPSGSEQQKQLYAKCLAIYAYTDKRLNAIDLNRYLKAEQIKSLG